MYLCLLFLAGLCHVVSASCHVRNGHYPMIQRPPECTAKALARVAPTKNSLPLMAWDG